MEYLRSLEIVNQIILRVQHFEVKDAIDIAIVSLMIYYLIRLVRNSSANRLLKGLLILLFVTWVTNTLKLFLTGWIMSNIINIGLIALVVIFQPELRRVLEQFGRSRFVLFNKKATDRKVMELGIAQTIEAVESLSKAKTGALIIFERNDHLDPIVSTGTLINSDISSELLKNIFYNKAPLHDGAVIVSEGRIRAAGCILPLSNNNSLSKDLGTRHRAAVGMGESYDSLSVTVSEETGSISLSFGGIIKRHLAPETLERLLLKELLPEPEEEKQGLLAWVRGKLK